MDGFESFEQGRESMFFVENFATQVHEIQENNGEGESQKRNGDSLLQGQGMKSLKLRKQRSPRGGYNPETLRFPAFCPGFEDVPREEKETNGDLTKMDENA